MLNNKKYVLTAQITLAIAQELSAATCGPGLSQRSRFSLVFSFTVLFVVAIRLFQVIPEVPAWFSLAPRHQLGSAQMSAPHR